MENLFKCDWDDCSFASAYKTSLTTHLRIHTGDKKYVCSFEDCEYRTTDASSLPRHLRIHISDKKYVCSFEDCRYRCTNPSNLKAHSLIHKGGPKKYQCDHDCCSYQTNKLDHLTIHMRTHTGEKPFACSFDKCASTFGRRSHRTSHEKTHLNIRPYSCKYDGCDYIAARMEHLKIHEERHLDERKYPCDHTFCDYISTNRDDIRKHKLTHSEKNQLRLKKKEEAVAKVLKAAHIDFKREHHIDMSCVSNEENKFVRIDFLIIKKGIIIILEVDEEQHRQYLVNCDSLRPFKIAETLALDGNTLPIGIIKFNPDSFRVDGKISNISKKDRYAKLVDTISKWNQNRPLAVHYMYYDSDADGNLCIALDKEFCKETLKVIQY